MMKYGTIYKITNNLNGMIYIGQTTQILSDRINSHKTEKRNRHISNAIRSYGFENFQVEEIATAFDKDSLNELEVTFVESFNSMYPNGYNHRAGGNQNGKCSDELRKKISEAKMGKPNVKRQGEVRSLEQRLQISRTLGGSYILMTEISTQRKTILNTAHQGSDYGFQPWNIISVCKGRRKSHKGFIFEYLDLRQSEVKD